MTNPQDLPGGIPSRITGLIAGIIRHFLTLGSLAAAEGQLFIRQSVMGLILLLALIVVAMIAYVALLLCGVAMLAIYLKWGWPISLAATGLIHLGFVAILYKLLRARISHRPFQATSSELQRDIEALSNYSSHRP